jgi:glucokinase
MSIMLGGDVGGTKTILALLEPHRGSLRILATESYPSREYPSLEEILDKFIRAHPRRIDMACFGVAGPVKGGRAETTNLPWVVDSQALASRLRIKLVSLLNDLAATAWGVGALKPADFYLLKDGIADPAGNAAVIAAGTGLGEAGLYWDGTARRPIPSEGGHCDFAPRNELQIELLSYLSAQFGHVSTERVLSGTGLYNLYRFLRDAKHTEEPAWLAEEMKTGDPAAIISRAALERKSLLCERALTLFVEIYGSSAGNLALKFMATAGVYLGGGIAPKILEKLNGPGFENGFVDKGRLGPLLKTIPVQVILNEKVALLGAARWMLNEKPKPARPAVRNAARRRRK